MDDLIEALTILRKYTGNEEYHPTYCGHVMFLVRCEAKVTPEDLVRLEELSFTPYPGNVRGFISDRFGC